MRAYGHSQPWNVEGIGLSLSQQQLRVAKKTTYLGFTSGIRGSDVDGDWSDFQLLLRLHQV